MKELVAEVLNEAHDPDLHGKPGAMILYTLHNRPGGLPPKKSGDCCCPGCGGEVFSLNSYMLTGSNEAPSLVGTIGFFCCGWKGTLVGGVWRGRSSKRPN